MNLAVGAIYDRQDALASSAREKACAPVQGPVLSPP